VILLPVSDWYGEWKVGSPCFTDSKWLPLAGREKGLNRIVYSLEGLGGWAP